MKTVAILLWSALAAPLRCDLSGQKWVRFAAWDSAVNGAFTQPIHLKGE